MSALNPGMIEFMRGDRAIPALKKALAKGIGNAGEPVSIHQIGVSGTMIPSLRKNPKNVQRATKKYWGEDEGLGQATGAMRYNRDWAAKTIKESRGKRFESLTPGMIEFGLPFLAAALPAMLRAGKVASMFTRTKARPTTFALRRRLSLNVQDSLPSEFSVRPGMIEFVDPRPRNDMGQYVGNETAGVDPNSMNAAYGNVEQEKMMRRRSLVQRMKAMMGRPQEQPMM
jgi:hypothetical protein